MTYIDCMSLPLPLSLQSAPASCITVVCVCVCMCERETKSVQWKARMNNSADASTRPPSIKPSPLMSLNDSHGVETIKVCVYVCACVCVCNQSVGGKEDRAMVL